MARKKNPAPTYALHQQTGRGRLIWTDAIGCRREKLLPGLFNSPESLAAKARLELEVLTSPARGPKTDSALSVAELLAAFWDHAEKHYRHPDGTPTEELNWYRFSMKPVREVYGDTAAAGFGPLALKTVRAKMVSDGLARPTANARIRRIKHIFKWACSEELVPVAVHQALATVAGLQRGRCDAPEPEPVGPVAVADVDATTPFLSPTIAGMVRVQLLTGMRPGEVCRLRPADIDRTGGVWFFTPKRHKNAHRGKPRVIAIGPKCQEVLKPFLDGAEPGGFVFSPRRELEQRSAERAKNRTTKYYASRQGWQKRQAKPNRAPSEAYTAASYGQAIRRAVAKANERRERLANGGEYDKLPVWSANQLRHTFATQVRKLHGLEASQVLLGHARCDTTQIYAEANQELAATVAALIG